MPWSGSTPAPTVCARTAASRSPRLGCWLCRWPPWMPSARLGRSGTDLLAREAPAAHRSASADGGQIWDLVRWRGEAVRPETIELVSAAPTEPTEPFAPTEPSEPRGRRIWLFALIAVLVLAADLVSKCLVVARIAPDRSVRLLGGAVYLVQVRNSGAAFSVGTGATVALTVIALLVVGVIVRAAR